MKRLLSLIALTAIGPLASLACEGEPPVMAPENPSGSGGGVEVMAASAAPAPEETAAAPAAQTACPPPPCTPVSSSAVATAAPPASASGSGEPAPLPVPPTSVARGNIIGAITTKPAGLQAQAVVYLEDGPTEDVPSRGQTVTIENRAMNFIPFVSVAAVGAKVVFANTDPFPHNVFSPDNDKFNMGNIPQNGAHVKTFKSPGAYSLLCNLHPGMLGYLVVTPSTWYAKADAKGKYVMKHVPNGTYKLTAWAPREAPMTQSVTVADGDVTVNFDMHR
jgi:plastocyanin